MLPAFLIGGIGREKLTELLSESSRMKCRGLAWSARGLVSTTAACSAARLRETGSGGEKVER
jgi:hypothetical protein